MAPRLAGAVRGVRLGRWPSWATCREAPWSPLLANDLDRPARPGAGRGPAAPPETYGKGGATPDAPTRVGAGAEAAIENLDGGNESASASMNMAYELAVAIQTDSRAFVRRCWMTSR